MKLFYQKYLPMKISPAKVSLNCRIALAKHLSKYEFNVEKQVSWLLIRSITGSERCNGIEKIKINKRKKTIESDTWHMTEFRLF